MHSFEVKTQPDLCPLLCGDCTVILEAPSDFSLHELALAILKAVKFDNDHSFGFYDNLKNPYRSKTQYTLFADYGQEEDESVPGVMETEIAAAFPKKGAKLMFLFDYGDDWHFLVACTGIAASAKEGKKIKIVSVTGTPPVQYRDFDEG